ncbi:hypothetical protein GZ77_23645 [Endozoicomonas montiporae]|uniref:Lipase n=2 Tax=Endozoicomonas montiporae TaxID=1027273 RepID=A0A081N0U8_9GAMM|nr:alpha/beta fold hydrolase [Endozoicomonas montiporae]AMO54554.1 lipase [Endozoicomonas montiporae CL-33]KEQ12071.1 hypothetical protein GZ77_23645 [Endozoicomonas montiporae]
MNTRPAKHTFLLLPLIALLSACSPTTRINSGFTETETVVIIHGLARSGSAMRYLTRNIADAGFQTCVIDYASLRRPMAEVVNDVSDQIDQCVVNGSRVHFVGHSLGGLLTRSYLADPDNAALRKRLGQVVMIGTPNHGSAVVDHYENNWWMKSLGDTTLSLGTHDDAFPNTLPPVDYHHGVIAGTRGWFLSNKVLGESNDGLVAVSSTRTTTMNDFVEVDVGHSLMRWNKEVAGQTVHFLKHGLFQH